MLFSQTSADAKYELLGPTVVVFLGVNYGF